MKLTTLLMIIGCIHVSAAAFSQKINLAERNVSLESVLSKMEKQSGYTFFSNSDFIGALPNVSLTIKNATLSEALDVLLSKVSLTYSIVGKTVVITPVNETVNGIKKNIPALVFGTVTDEQSKPIPGANVKVKGTLQRTVTDQNGKFRILVNDPENDVLQISYVGFQNKEIRVKSIKAPLVIELKAITSDLDQVQILAYTTTTKRLNMSSSYTIKADEIAKNPVPNILQVLENRVPGLSIIQNTGQAGGSFNVKVRGINGLNTVDPLYIVDGVPFPAGGINGNPNGVSGGLPTLANNRSSGATAQQGGNALNYINPNDIESIDVLKDAAATSIYGSRGAYGVILITTKKGKAGKPQLSFNLNRGTTIPGSNPQLLGTDDYLMLRREAIKNDGLTVTAADVDLNGTYPVNAYTNWSKELTGHSASTTRLNTTYSGGNESTTFSIGGNYDDQGNVLQAKGYNRDGAMRLRLTNTTPNKKFSIDVSAYYTSTVNTMVPYDFTGDANILRAPNAPSYFLSDGSLNWIAGTNPYSYINVIYKSVTNNLIGSTTLNYNPVKGLNIRAVTGYNLLSGSELRETPSSVFNPAIVNRGVLTNSSSNVYNIRTWSFEPFASYVTPISKGTLTVTAGATFQDKLNNQTTVSGTGFVADARLNNPSAGTTLTQYYNQTQTRYQGYFGSVSYNWANKFIVDFSSRYDGSTKFGPDHRYGLFGSVDGGYIFSQEKWIKETLPFLSFGKLKGSYGTSGGDGIPSYIYLSTYATGTAYLGNTTFLNNGLANANLHWEMTRKKDVGMTLGFLKDAITIDVDYYKNTTTQSLVLQPISSVTGFTSIGQNSPATTQSTGLEFSVLTTNINRKNLRWTTNFVLTMPKTKLVAFPPGLVLSNSNYVVGSSLTNIKVYDYAGVNPATGEYNYRNAAGVQGAYLVGLSQADKVVNIDVSPKFFGSVSNTITYKSFSLDFTFSLVNKMGNNFQGLLTYLPGTINQNETTWALDRWQKPGDVTNVPKATTSFISSYLGQNNFRQSSGAYERIIYSRLQNASLSYNLADSFFKRINVNNMRVFVNGQNLLTFSKYHDLDPDNPALNSLPPLRVINVGVNFTL